MRTNDHRGPVVIVIIGPHRFLTPWVCASSTATPLRWSGCLWIIGPRPWPRACEVSRPDRLDVRAVRLAFQTCCGFELDRLARTSFPRKKKNDDDGWLRDDCRPVASLPASLFRSSSLEMISRCSSFPPLKNLPAGGRSVVPR